MGDWTSQNWTKRDGRNNQEQQQQQQQQQEEKVTYKTAAELAVKKCPRRFTKNINENSPKNAHKNSPTKRTSHVQKA